LQELTLHFLNLNKYNILFYITHDDDALKKIQFYKILAQARFDDRNNSRFNIHNEAKG
jgi:hypothetical protein